MQDVRPGAIPSFDPPSLVDLKLPLIRVGDAYDLVSKIPQGTVDCILTSPPYWGLRSYGQDHDESVLERWERAHPNLTRHDLATHGPGYEWYRENGGILGLEPYPQWFVTHLVEIFERLRPALKSTASVWVNLGDTYFARWSSIRQDGRQGLAGEERGRRVSPAVGFLKDKQLLLVPARFAIAMQDAGWILRNDVIWSKSSSLPGATPDRLKLSHEHFFHFVLRPKEGRAKYHYDSSAAEDGALDVVHVRPQRGRDGHSATFPKALIAPRIASSCPPGGLVVDPFAGTGRTLESAIELGREAHGIEISSTYAAAARTNARRAREAQLTLPNIDIDAGNTAESIRKVRNG